MQTFETRALPDRIDDLIRAAESGGLSIVTRAGRPIFVAVPFDEMLLRNGIKVALARRLFDQEAISLAQAARLAGTRGAEFMAHPRRAGIPIARPRPGELERELADFG